MSLPIASLNNSLTELCLSNIALYVVCLVLGLFELLLPRQARLILLTFGPVVPAYITSLFTYSAVAASTLVNILIYTLGVGICIIIIAGSVFRMVPFLGPAVFLGVTLLGVAVPIRCAVGVVFNALYMIVPLAVGVFVGFTVYFWAGVSMTRDSLFFWPKSRLLQIYHTIVISLTSSFLIVTSVIYFSQPTHVNMIPSLVSALSLQFRDCNTFDACIEAGVCLATFVAICLTRTARFEGFAQKRLRWRFFQLPRNEFLDHYDFSRNSSNSSASLPNDDATAT